MWLLNDIDPQTWLADVLARIADTPISKLVQLLPCWGGRLPTASQCARMSSLKAQSRETVRGTDYPNWYGYVKECVPIAWREHSRTTSPSQEAVA
ncbi:transposase domain-containing protein (plasmid) [Rhizobium leguminosarum]|nr:transposase domain-containing protein [Rhizobium leguminosarum]